MVLRDGSHQVAANESVEVGISRLKMQRFVVVTVTRVGHRSKGYMYVSIYVCNTPPGK